VGHLDVSTPVSALATDSDVIGDDRSSIDLGTRSRVRTDFDQAFVDHYERLVRALTVVAAGDREAAADAVQEAFVKAHLRWRRIGHYDDPVGWIRRVAINRLRDGNRKDNSKRKALARLATRSEIEHHDPEIDEFDRLLATLPRQQRVAAALFYVDGLPVAEIASALGIAEGSVKSHLYDARQRLRPLLTPPNQDPS
jgi:RNA polymerase sigma-70 factor (ECF subfamily)